MYNSIYRTAIKQTTLSGFKNSICSTPRFPLFSSSSHSPFLVRNMATSSTIKLSVSEHPAFHLPSMNQEGADMASEFLTENHRIHHIFFNDEGFHVSLSPASLAVTPKA